MSTDSSSLPKVRLQQDDGSHSNSPIPLDEAWMVYMKDGNLYEASTNPDSPQSVQTIADNLDLSLSVPSTSATDNDNEAAMKDFTYMQWMSSRTLDCACKIAYSYIIRRYRGDSSWYETPENANSVIGAAYKCSELEKKTVGEGPGQALTSTPILYPCQTVLVSAAKAVEPFVSDELILGDWKKWERENKKFVEAPLSMSDVEEDFLRCYEVYYPDSQFVYDSRRCNTGSKQ